MSFLSHIHKDRLHHAYIIEGVHTDCLPKLLSFIETELLLSIVGNPNIWREEVEVFGIDDGRRLKEMQSLRASSGEKKIFVISAQQITREAQNSLLKVLEEPTAGTHFFFIIPTVSILLPTILSRVVCISSARAVPIVVHGKNDGQVLATQFSESSIAERLTIAKKLSESEHREEVMQFVNALEVYWYKKASEKKTLAQYYTWFQTLALCRSYLSDRSASVKMLLEHLVLSVPKK